MEQQLRQQLTALIPRLRRFAAGLTGSAGEDADDIVQLACERALSRLHQWQPGTRFDSWMFRIVQTVWFNERAARKRRPNQGDSGLEGVHGEDSVRRAEAQLTLDAVRRAFSHLSEEKRVVVLLVCVEGFTYKEAAETLGVPVGTVMSRLARGRLALFEALKETAPAAPGRVIPLS